MDFKAVKKPFNNNDAVLFQILNPMKIKKRQAFIKADWEFVFWLIIIYASACISN